MKKLFALLLVFLMVFSLAACGDNNTTDPDKDNPGTSQGGENNDNPNMRFGFYLQDSSLSKIDSLPKTEEGKRVVSRTVRDAAVPNNVTITIYTWSDPDAMYDTRIGMDDRCVLLDERRRSVRRA